MLDFRPERKWHVVDLLTARVLRGLYNNAWVEAVAGEKQRFGLPGVLPFAPQLEKLRGRRTFDFIGVNYYTRAYVQWRPRSKTQESIPQIPVGISFARRREQASDLGWAVHPKGLRRILESLRRFNAPIYITENGIADATDDLRSQYLHAHLTEVARARVSGLDVRGYYHWSLIDNFEWIKGFWPRFGLAAIDYETMQRSPRPSAKYYRELIEAHGFSGAPDELVLKRALADLPQF
jgi:beta-glucosidase/6-phospho-beta-glucosidase/beta-galactosidase